MIENNVILIGYYGGDETHCNSAWQSTDVELGIDYPNEINKRSIAIFEATAGQKKKTPEELLKFLAEASHHTPFEKSLLHFQVTAEIATHIHFLKHRVGTSINTESARYKELQDKWYVPDDWKGTNAYAIGCNTDDYDYTVEPFATLNLPSNWAQALDEFNKLAHWLYHLAIEQLTPKLGRKRAKESARYFLPYAKQLNFDVSFNFRSFMHFQKLRNSVHAQKEVREIAELMLKQVQEIEGQPFGLSLKAFGY